MGFPRIGAKRELKHALESAWAKCITEPQLAEATKAIRAENWRIQKAARIDLIPSNDFSLYDQMPDMCALAGAAPERFHWRGDTVNPATYFAMARGVSGQNDQHACCDHGNPARAMEMTKWFDTNYHYLVPDLDKGQNFRLASTKPFDEFAEALALGIRTVPVIIGPLTFLELSKAQGDQFDRLSLLPKLVPIYAEILRRLKAQGENFFETRVTEYQTGGSLAW